MSALSTWSAKLNATLEGARQDLRSTMAKSLSAAAHSLATDPVEGGKTRFFRSILEHAIRARDSLQRTTAALRTGPARRPA